MSDEEKTEASAAEKFFPLGNRYKLYNGTIIEVKPWGIQTMTRVSQRVPEAIEQFMTAPKDKNIVAMVPMMMDEVTQIVAETIGWPVEKVQKEMTADDLLGVTTLVWEVCMVGPMEKMMGLAVKVSALVGGLGAQPQKSTPTKLSPRPLSS